MVKAMAAAAGAAATAEAAATLAVVFEAFAQPTDMYGQEFQLAFLQQLQVDPTQTNSQCVENYLSV